jgi:uncharacterized membrane protein
MYPQPKPLVSAGFVLGVGMGGFLDGIVFHQLLQTHNMLSAILPKTTIANVEVNMFWDGVFHAFAWIATAFGLHQLWRAGARREVPWSGELLLGAMLMGWGAFNLIEGAVDHHLLGVHHVIEALGLSAFDWAFLVSGPALFGIGWAITRRRSARGFPMRLASVAR